MEMNLASPAGLSSPHRRPEALEHVLVFASFFERWLLLVDIGFVEGRGWVHGNCSTPQALCHPNMEPWQLTPYENSIEMCNAP